MKIKKLWAIVSLAGIISILVPLKLNFGEPHQTLSDWVDVEASDSLPNVEREILWLARAVYSETKDAHEQKLVAWVIRNRVEAGFRGLTYEEVVLASNQFSGLNPLDPQYAINISRDYGDAGEAWLSALALASQVYSAPASERLVPKEVLHFYSPISARREPLWASGREPVHLIKDENSGYTRFAFYDGIK